MVDMTHDLIISWYSIYISTQANRWHIMPAGRFVEDRATSIQISGKVIATADSVIYLWEDNRDYCISSSQTISPTTIYNWYNSCIDSALDSLPLQNLCIKLVVHCVLIFVFRSVLWIKHGTLFFSVNKVVENVIVSYVFFFYQRKA